MRCGGDLHILAGCIREHRLGGLRRCQDTAAAVVHSQSYIGVGDILAFQVIYQSVIGQLRSLFFLELCISSIIMTNVI